jgi:hypothetical protein
VPETGANQTEGAVEFDYAWFQRRYPEISEWVSPDVAQSYFELATGFCSPSNSGPPSVPDLWTIWSGGATPQYRAIFIDTQTRQRLLGLLTAHIAKLFAPVNGVPSPDFVGRLNSASEGSVSVGLDFPGISPNAAWYMQTKYGAMYWQLTARYRTMRYFPGRQPFRQLPFNDGTY